MDTISNNYQSLFSNIMMSTDSSRIHWRRQNATTIFYEKRTKTGEKIIISIQKIHKMNNEHFLFNVNNIDKNELVFSMDTINQDEFKNQIRIIYEKGMIQIERKSFDLLTDIIFDH